MSEPFIVWINGAFGSGKTSVATELLRLRPEWVLFDPEEVGFMARAICGPYETFSDFQDLAIWAPLVVETASALLHAFGRTLVIPMTVVDETKWTVLRSGFGRLGPVHHFTLRVSSQNLSERLTARGDGPGSWPQMQIERCVAALEDPRFDVHLDAEGPSPEEIAATIIGRIMSPHNA